MSEGIQHRFHRLDAAHAMPSPTPGLPARIRRQLTRVLDRHIPLGSRVALVDFPNHSNVGDSAIWLGELAYLRQRRARVCHVSDVSSYDRRRLARAVRGGVILLHGGGNFGDLWPAHHELRLQVIRDFPRHRVIQLPQSIHFQTGDWLDETRHVLECHPKLTLLVRDRASRAFALRKFNVEINLCPDMAFQLELSRPPSTADCGATLLLARTDHERRIDGSLDPTGLPAQFRVEDWVTESRPPGAKLYSHARSKRVPAWCWPPGLRAGLLHHLSERIARHRLERGVAQLSRASFVVTDRLHAHILCLLLNQPHVIVDNSYGKLGSFHETWTSESPGVRLASSWREAIEVARSRLEPRSEHPAPWIAGRAA